MEQFDFELEKVLENIADPNTDAKKTRKITITMNFKPNERRTIAALDFQTKASLAAAKPVTTEIIIDKDPSGKILASELSKGEIPGQVGMEETKPTNVVAMNK